MPALATLKTTAVRCDPRASRYVVKSAEVARALGMGTVSWTVVSRVTAAPGDLASR